MATKKRGNRGKAGATKAYSDDTKAEGLKLYADGVSISEIARRLGTSLQTPRNWLNSAKKAGTAVLAPASARRRSRGARRAAPSASAPSATASGSLSARDAKLLAAIKAAFREYVEI